MTSQIDALIAEIEFYKRREKDICAALGGVGDGGKYRNDIIDAIRNRLRPAEPIPDWYIERTKDWPPDHPKPPPYHVSPWEHVSGTWYRTTFAPFEDYAAHVWILGNGRSGRVGVRVKSKDGREVKCEAARPDVGREVADVLLKGFGWPV